MKRTICLLALTTLACGGIPGLSAKTPTDAEYDAALEKGYDRFGMDYQEMDVKGDAPRPCLEACQEDRKCQAWTWQPPDGEVSAHCWLKEGVPERTKSPGYVSGKRVP